MVIVYCKRWYELPKVPTKDLHFKISRVVLWVLNYDLHFSDKTLVAFKPRVGFAVESHSKMRYVILKVEHAEGGVKRVVRGVKNNRADHIVLVSYLAQTELRQKQVLRAF